MPESMMAVMCASKHCGRGLYPSKAANVKQTVRVANFNETLCHLCAALCCLFLYRPLTTKAQSSTEVAQRELVDLLNCPE